MAKLDAAQRRDRRSTAVAYGILVVLLTVIAAPILVIAAVVFFDDRAVLDAYKASPPCGAGATSPDASCKRDVEYHASGESGHAGQNSVWYLYVTDFSGAETRLQLTEPTGVWPAADGEAVTVTSWRGAPVSVSDGRHVSDLVGAPDLRTGDGAYGVLCIVGAVYLYLVLIVLIRRALGPLLLVPAAILTAGIAVHGKIVGGPWTHDLLLFVFALPVVLVFFLTLLDVSRTRRGKAARLPVDVDG